ncbi:hypothetical protein Mal48_37360 [Thalassoglobus polymorphus]|uniref:Uncharacterized protein n=1 Tax=Thalassoglobus polymorphus TaxID=2527994 RepID=A0A517QS82_9PLAN|nr:hypothetical protein Mal48_37360 [Thalassoglobus polymorphus]
MTLVSCLHGLFARMQNTNANLRKAIDVSKKSSPRSTVDLEEEKRVENDSLSVHS